MFRLFITLIFLIPNIYVFFRIKDLFISKGYKLWFLLVYLIIIAIYPVPDSFRGRGGNLVHQSLSFLSNYILPFYLYLFLTVLCFDLFLLINHLIRILPPETRESLSFRTYSLAAIIITVICVIIGGVINMNTIRVSEYQINVPRRHSNMDRLRVAFIADFHINQYIPLGFFEQLVRKVNALRPDLMLYGGDIMEGNWGNMDIEPIEKILSAIHAKYGVYGILGNHELYGRHETGSFFPRTGITLLRDSIVKIDSSFYLAGRYDQLIRGRKNVDEIIGTDTDLPLILLDHRPTELQKTSLSPVDVQFSGHLHDGQLFPINLILRNMYELTWGYKKIRNTHFFVTSGIRLWGPPVKTAGKSEIMLVDIHFE